MAEPRMEKIETVSKKELISAAEELRLQLFDLSRGTDQSEEFFRLMQKFEENPDDTSITPHERQVIDEIMAQINRHFNDAHQLASRITEILKTNNDNSDIE